MSDKIQTKPINSIKHKLNKQTKQLQLYTEIWKYASYLI